jgi:hypothetical protein
MKQLTIAFAILASVGSARADDSIVATAPHNTIGVDGIGVLPIGDYAHAATLGIGALGRLEIPAGPGFATVRAGVVGHAGTPDNVALTLVPIYAGFRVPVGTGGAYLAGELGITVAFGSVVAVNGTMVTASDSKLGLTFAGGVRRGALDFRAGLFAPDIGNAIGLMASAGIDFVSF